MKVRKTARSILLDPSLRVFMQKIKLKESLDPNRPLLTDFWITPGGMIEENESPSAALERELYEETRIKGLKIHEPAAWYGEVLLRFKGEDTLYKETFFIVFSPTSEVILDGLNEGEKEALSDHRWWTLEEMKKSQEIFIPKNFVKLLEPIIKQKILPKQTQTIDLSTP